MLFGGSVCSFPFSTSSGFGVDVAYPNRARGCFELSPAFEEPNNDSYFFGSSARAGVKAFPPNRELG